MRILILLLCLCGALAAAPNLAILPASVDLAGPADSQQVLAEATVDDHQEDWTRTARWTSSNPAIARVDQTGLITPAGDGTATVTATASGRTASVTVHVHGAHAAPNWNFRNDVIPVLTKMGCNSGAISGGKA